MNCARAWLRPWHGGLAHTCFALCLIAPAGSLHAENLGAPVKVAADYAHLSPSPKVDTPKDLELTPEANRQAGALAAFVEGFLAEDEADGDRALERYQRVLALDPGYTELAAKVAAELERRGSTADAINVLKDAAKAAPKSALPRLFLAGLYHRSLKKPDLAEKYVTEAIALEPTNPTALRIATEIYLATDQKAKAEQLLERSAKSPVATPQFWLELAQISSRVYLNDEGVSDAADLVKYDAILQHALSLVGDDVQGIVKIADCYVLSRQVKEAIPLYARAISLQPKSSDQFMAATRDKLAKSFQFLGDRDEALRILEDLEKNNPERFETHEALGELYEEKGDYDKALASYERGLQLDDTQPATYLRVADMYLKMQAKKKDQAMADKAVAILKSAQEKFPDTGAVTYSLAIALGRAGMHDRALEVFDEAQTDFSSTQPELLNAAFYLAYGAEAEQANDLDKAVEMLKKSIEIDPDFAEAYNYLGYMWVDRGINVEEAGQLIQKALARDPANPAYIDSLGWYYFKKGEFEKALGELQKAAEALTPEDAVVFDHLADTYQKLGNIPQALVYWQKAVTLDPSDKKIAEKLEQAKQKVTTAPQASPR